MNISTPGWSRVLGFGDGGMEHKFANTITEASTYEGKINL
jgi:hypothetical protein